MISLWLSPPARAAKSDDDAASAPDTALEIARKLGVSSDDARPAQQRETLLLGKRLILGGELSATVRGRDGYDLKHGANDGDIEIAPEATLETIWLPSESGVVFASAKAFGQSTLYQEGGGAGNAKADVVLNNLWLFKTGLFGTPLAMQVGRQRLQDRREWWWDESLDAARVHYFGTEVTAFVGAGLNAASLSTEGRVAPEDRGLLRVVGHADWAWRKRQNVGVFVLHQDDRTRRYAVGDIIGTSSIDDRDARLTWVGARATGCVKPGLPRQVCYWGDVAQVRGSETEYDLDNFSASSRIVDQVDRRTVRGQAYDVGSSIELPLPIKPYLTLGYARGSGDKAGTPGRDGAFRQTGLHKNEGKYRGLSRFRYYGEVLRPNLSNIAIGTVALGVPVGEHGWVETVWHRYRQPVADNRISGSRLNENPDGNNGKLGDEFDVVASYRPASAWEFALTGGVFRAGAAFGKEAGRRAGLIEVKVDYNF